MEARTTCAFQKGSRSPFVSGTPMLQKHPSRAGRTRPPEPASSQRSIPACVGPPLKKCIFPLRGDFPPDVDGRGRFRHDNDRCLSGNRFYASKYGLRFTTRSLENIVRQEVVLIVKYSFEEKYFEIPYFISSYIYFSLPKYPHTGLLEKIAQEVCRKL